MGCSPCELATAGFMPSCGTIRDTNINWEGTLWDRFGFRFSIVEYKRGRFGRAHKIPKQCPGGCGADGRRAALSCVGLHTRAGGVWKLARQTPPHATVAPSEMAINSSARFGITGIHLILAGAASKLQEHFSSLVHTRGPYRVACTRDEAVADQ